MSRENSVYDPTNPDECRQLWSSFSPLFYRLKDTHGFTLLEVLIAIAIIAIALTSLFSSQSSSLSLAIEAKFNTTSTLLAREIVAEYESGVRPFVGDEGDFGEEFAGYTWQAEVEEASFEQLDLGGGDRPLYRVDLTISWNDSNHSSSFTWFGRELSQDG